MNPVSVISDLSLESSSDETVNWRVSPKPDLLADRTYFAEPSFEIESCSVSTSVVLFDSDVETFCRP